jgi:gas vesicle protein
MRFLLGLLLGAALGVAVGLVLAPQPGSETRKALREQLQRNPAEDEEEEQAEAEGVD